MRKGYLGASVHIHVDVEIDQRSHHRTSLGFADDIEEGSGEAYELRKFYQKTYGQWETEAIGMSTEYRRRLTCDFLFGGEEFAQLQDALLFDTDGLFVGCISVYRHCNGVARSQ